VHVVLGVEPLFNCLFVLYLLVLYLT